MLHLKKQISNQYTYTSTVYTLVQYYKIDKYLDVSLRSEAQGQPIDISHM